MNLTYTYVMCYIALGLLLTMVGYILIKDYRDAKRRHKQFLAHQDSLNSLGTFWDRHTQQKD